MPNLPRARTVISFLEKLWALLTDPPPSVEEPDRRGETRLLATSLLVIIAVLSTGVGLVWLIPQTALFSGNQGRLLGITVVLMLLLSYALTRKGYYTLASIAAIVGLEVGMFATPVLGWLGACPYYGTEDVNFLIYTVIPILVVSPNCVVYGIITENSQE